MRIASCLGILLLITSVAASPPARADRRDFDVENGTPWPIYYIFVRVTGTRDWGEDVMQEDVLMPSSTVHLQFNGGRACFHDIRIRYANAVDEFWNRVDLCAVTNFRIWYDYNQRKYQATFE